MTIEEIDKETGIDPEIDLGKEIATVETETEDAIEVGQKIGGAEGKEVIQEVETAEIEVGVRKKAKLTETVRNWMMTLYRER